MDEWPRTYPPDIGPCTVRRVSTPAAEINDLRRRCDELTALVAQLAGRVADLEAEDR